MVHISFCTAKVLLWSTLEQMSKIAKTKVRNIRCDTVLTDKLNRKIHVEHLPGGYDYSTLWSMVMTDHGPLSCPPMFVQGFSEQ